MSDIPALNNENCKNSNPNNKEDTSNPSLTILLKPFSSQKKSFCCSSSSTLTDQEQQKLARLKNICKEEYSQANTSHAELLSSIQTSFTTLIENIPFTWKAMGFQSENPSSDLRVSGFYTLKLITFIIEHTKELFITCCTQETFPFAIVLVKMVFQVELFLNFFDQKEMETLANVYKITPITKEQKKSFVRLLDANDNALNIIIIKMMQYLINKYKRKFLPKKGELNILKIEPFISSSLKRLRRCLDEIHEKRDESNEVDVNKTFLNKHFKIIES